MSLEKKLKSVLDEIASYLAGAVNRQVRFGRGGKAPGAKKRGRRGPVKCIKPGCPNPNVGPRNHFLCAEHKGSPATLWKKWRAIKA